MFRIFLQVGRVVPEKEFFRPKTMSMENSFHVFIVKICCPEDKLGVASRCGFVHTVRTYEGWTNRRLFYKGRFLWMESGHKGSVYFSFCCKEECNEWQLIQQSQQLYPYPPSPDYTARMHFSFQTRAAMCLAGIASTWRTTKPSFGRDTRLHTWSTACGHTAFHYRRLEVILV